MGKKKSAKTGETTPIGGEPERIGKAVPEDLRPVWEKLRSQPAISATRLADRLGFRGANGHTSGRPKQLVDDGVIAGRPGGKPGRVAYGPEAILDYVCWLRDRADARDGSSRGLIEAEKLRALKRENDLAESRLFTAEVLEDALGKIVREWILILEAEPIRWKREFPETTGDQLDHIKRLVAEMRNALADAAVDVAKSQE